jgi:hypothetical protein
MPKFEIYHNYKGTKESIVKTSFAREGIRLARSFAHNFEQTPTCYHTVEIDGVIHDINAVAEMDAQIEVRKRNASRKKRQRAKGAK